VHNVCAWVDAVLRLWLDDGVRQQAQAFARGWSQVFNVSCLRCFDHDELRGMLCGELVTCPNVWDAQSLQRHVHPGDGFTRDSVAFKLLLEYMDSLPATTTTADEPPPSSSGVQSGVQSSHVQSSYAVSKVRLLQFVTGLSALPTGGLRCLRSLLGPPAPPNDGITVDLMRTDALGNTRSAEHLRKTALPRCV
jgi:hypothetical protein